MQTNEFTKYCMQYSKNIKIKEQEFITEKIRRIAEVVKEDAELYESLCMYYDSEQLEAVIKMLLLTEQGLFTDEIKNIELKVDTMFCYLPEYAKKVRIYYAMSDLLYHKPLRLHKREFEEEHTYHDVKLQTSYGTFKARKYLNDVLFMQSEKSIALYQNILGRKKRCHEISYDLAQTLCGDIYTGYINGTYEEHSILHSYVVKDGMCYDPNSGIVVDQSTYEFLLDPMVISVLKYDNLPSDRYYLLENKKAISSALYLALEKEFAFQKVKK